MRVPQRTDFVYRLLLTDNPGYTPEITIRLGKFSANASIEVNLSPAAEAKIRLLVDGGTPVPSGSKTVNCDSEGVDPVVDYRQRVVMGTDTQATLSLPYHVALECSVRFNNGALDAHFKDIEFSSSAVKLLNLPETGEVTIKLVEENGQEFTGGGIVWHDSNASSSCSSSPCRLRLPPRTPLDLHVLFASGTYRNFTIGPEVFPPGTVRVIPLIREYAVKGNVSFAGLDSGHTRIRALDSTSGRLVLSVKTQWPTGDFELPLVAGKYIFEAERNLGDLPPGEAAYRAPWRSDPIQISRNTELPPFVVEDDLGQLALTAEVPCHGSGNYQTDSAARVIFTSATGARIERVVSADSAGSTTSTPCLSLYLAALSAGTYNIEFSPVGWPAQSLGPVMVTAGATTALTAAFSSSSRTLVWSGTLRTASGEPVTNAFINLFNGALDNRISAWTDAQGRFQFPFASGWIAQVTTGTFQAGTAAVPQIVHLGTTPPSSNLRLDDLALVNEIDSGLYRLFGDGQRDKRFNLVFVAEGYTDVIETFTDTNGNGIWDGNIWYDIDGDGVYSQGDLNRTYGSAPYPVEGTIPTAGNEPFADTNADGFPSLDDRGLFLENVRAFLKSLFGSDFWDQHRNAFNAYALFEPSDQAGYSIITSNGDMLLPRNTRYGATLLRGSDTLAIDRSQALLNRAHVALPETDLAVAMINQPIFVGEANASRTLLVYRGGPASLSNGSAVPAHGMGHAIAGLCDEFGEFSGVTQRRWQSGAYCPNVSLSPNPLHIPWANWLIPGSKIPSSSIDDSIGIFEGAQFYSGGTYRPSYRSMMRDSTPLFNAPSRAALEMAVHTRTGEWQDEADNLGRCARLPPTAIRRQGVTCR